MIAEADKEAGGLFASYVEFVWEEFCHPHKDLEKYADKYLKEKGGVSRAINIPEIYTPFYGTHIIADQIYFKWKDEGKVKYTLSFGDSDQNGRKLFELTLKDTSLSVSTKTAWMPLDETFYWSVSLEGENPANFFPLKIFGKNDAEIQEYYDLFLARMGRKR